MRKISVHEPFHGRPPACFFLTAFRTQLCIAFYKTQSSNASPSTPLSEMNTTGNFPIYASHNAVSFEIASSSNSDLSVPTSKKHFSMLMFSVLPKRRGRANRLTFPQLFSCSAGHESVPFHQYKKAFLPDFFKVFDSHRQLFLSITQPHFPLSRCPKDNGRNGV